MDQEREALVSGGGRENLAKKIQAFDGRRKIIKDKLVDDGSKRIGSCKRNKVQRVQINERLGDQVCAIIRLKVKKVMIITQ